MTDAASSNQPPHAPAPPPAARTLRRWLVRRLLVLVLAYAVWCALMFSMQGSFIFPRSIANQQPRLPAVPSTAQQWWHDVQGVGRVEAWLFPGAGRSAENPGPAVMLFHGNAELIDHWVELAEWYQTRGITALLPEYRGYGRSDGSPSQQAITADMLAFYDRLASSTSVRSGAIALHGRSLGGGVAAQVAAQRPAGALVLDSTFTSIASFSWRYGVPPFLVRSPFRTDRVLPGLSGVPVLIAHGTRDEIVPYAHSQTLLTLRPDATFLSVESGHLDFPGDADAYERELAVFLRKAGLLPQPASAPSTAR